MFKVEKVLDAKGHTLIQDPPIARFFFQSTITAWLWLAVRLYVGYDFLDAGWHKFNNPAWMDGSGQGCFACDRERRGEESREHPGGTEGDET